MNKLKYILLAFSFIFSAISYADMEDAKIIRSVWNMTSQPCNGVPGNSFSRSPNENKIKSNKTVELKGLGLIFKVPQYPKAKETVVKLFIGDKSRGVTDNYILISDQDLKAPFAAIVITELPARMRDRNRALAAVKTLESQLARKAGIKIEFEDIDGPHGPSLQMVINNRVGSHCYPTSDFKFLPKENSLKTIGISRFSFISEELVEFSIIVEIPKDVKKSEAVGYAETIMDDYWIRLKNNN